jgi:hypothetical protein
MSSLSISFHGGSSANSINNILAVPTSGSFVPQLAPNSRGSLPALSELRGFFTDSNGNLYVLNSHKDFSNILTFEAPSAAGDPYTFTGVFASGAKDGLSHPFCAVLASDGHIYVSNQDPLSGQTSSAITYYEGPSMAHPGKYKGVFADSFITLRGIATDGTYWYVADEGDSKTPAAVWIYDSSGKRQSNSLSVNQPVHLLYDGSRYLYIGSESDNAVYRYDTKNGGAPAKFISSLTTAPIDRTAGVAISGQTIYVASRKGQLVNQYPLSNSSAGTTYVKGLADQPEFILFF